MPKWRIAERELSLSLLNTAVDALAMLVVGAGARGRRAERLGALPN